MSSLDLDCDIPEAGEGLHIARQRRTLTVDNPNNTLHRLQLIYTERSFILPNRRLIAQRMVKVLGKAVGLDTDMDNFNNAGSLLSFRVETDGDRLLAQRATSADGVYLEPEFLHHGVGFSAAKTIAADEFHDRAQSFDERLFRDGVEQEEALGLALREEIKIIHDRAAGLID